MRPEEAARLEREEFEAQGFVPNIERLLVAVDASPSGQFASRLVGLLAGARRIPTTVLHFDYATAELAARGGQAGRAHQSRRQGKRGSRRRGRPGGARRRSASRLRPGSRSPAKRRSSAEAKKGYGLLFIGREPASEGDTFHEQITHSAVEFAGPFAIAIARGIDRQEIAGTRLNILVPVTGTAASRHGAEVAIALAQASQRLGDRAPRRRRADDALARGGGRSARRSRR